MRFSLCRHQYTSYYRSRKLGTLSKPLSTSLHMPQISPPQHPNVVISQFFIKSNPEVGSYHYMNMISSFLKAGIVWLYLHLLNHYPMDSHFGLPPTFCYHNKYPICTALSTRGSAFPRSEIASTDIDMVKLPSTEGV